jgi:cytochrome P450
VQEALREELINCPTDTPSADELNTLPMLDKILREALRLYTPVSATMRQAAEDTVIPLGKPIIDKNGVVRSELW